MVEKHSHFSVSWSCVRFYLCGYLIYTALLLTLAVCRRRCDGMRFQLDSHHITNRHFCIYIYIYLAYAILSKFFLERFFHHSGMLSVILISIDWDRKKHKGPSQTPNAWSNRQKFIPFSSNLWFENGFYLRSMLSHLILWNWNESIGQMKKSKISYMHWTDCFAILSLILEKIHFLECFSKFWRYDRVLCWIWKENEHRYKVNEAKWMQKRRRKKSYF